MPFALKKVPGGKLVRVELTIDGNTIASCRITGDFFLYPEETLVRMEEAIKGSRIPPDAKNLQAKLNLSTRGASLVGFTLEDVVELVLTAMPQRAARAAIPGETLD